MTGFININKSAGASSAKEVAVIKRLSKTPCGHMGTLDPMASGVLPVALGNAARLFDYFLKKKKTYIADFKFGADSDTLDTTGQVVYSAGRVPSAEEIKAVLPEFTGGLMQLPPKYSAKNVAGKRAYELARQGVEFELEKKKVEIYSIKLIRENADCFGFEIECGGGTYIRSLARDIGARLGTCAVMSALERTKSGVFSIENSVKTQALTPDNFIDYVIPTESVLPYPEFHPDAYMSKKLFNGLSAKCGLPDGLYKIYQGETFYGIARAEQSIIKIRTKLC